MNILTSVVENEIKIKNSRFIAELFPVTDQKTARSIIKEQKTRYKDARHVVHAFIIGHQAEIAGMSDDGEPSGTAGHPVLDVLKGRNVTNVLLTVTRYFGGTLLGTGGLVKAYGDSAKLVLNKAANKNLFDSLVDRTDFFCKVPYSLHKIIKNILDEYNIIGLKETFTEEVEITGKLECSQFSTVVRKITDISAGSVSIQKAP